MKQNWVTKSGVELSREAMKRVEAPWSVPAIPMGLLRKALSMYYGIGADGISSSGLGRSGQFGEKIRTHINYLRFYVQTIKSMVIGDRLSFSVSPRRNSADAVRKAALLDKALKYLSQSLLLDRLAGQYVELGLLTGKSYMHTSWSAMRGDEIPQASEPEAPETPGAQAPEQYTTSGGIKLNVYTPLEVWEERGAREDKEVAWRIVRDQCNRFDYIASYATPDDVDKYFSLPTATPIWLAPRPGTDGIDEDTVDHYTLYHKKSPAVPQGLELKFMSSDLPLTQGPLSYSRIPLVPYMPALVYGTSMGYTPTFDLLGVNDVFNMLMSIAITTHKVLGGNNVAVFKGSGLQPPSVVNGMNFFEVAPGMEPRPLQLGVLDPSLLEHAQFWQGIMQQLSGMNDAALGNVSRETSGAALAQMDAKALQFTSGAQEAFATSILEVATLMCEIFVTRMLNEQYALFLGPDAISWAEGVPVEVLADMSDVEIQFANPAQGTPAMRLEEARLMLEQGLLKSPQQYFELRDTGTLEPVLESPRNHAMLIRDENELLRQGENPPVLITDLHPEHFQEHRSVLDSPEVRKDPAVVQAAMEHMFGSDQSHMWAVEQLLANPQIATVLGIDLSALAMLQQNMAAFQRGTPDQPNPEPPQQVAETPEVG